MLLSLASVAAVAAAGEPGRDGSVMDHHKEPAYDASHAQHDYYLQDSSGDYDKHRHPQEGPHGPHHGHHKEHHDKHPGQQPHYKDSCENDEEPAYGAPPHKHGRESPYDHDLDGNRGIPPYELKPEGPCGKIRRLWHMSHH